MAIFSAKAFRKYEHITIPPLRGVSLISLHTALIPSKNLWLAACLLLTLLSACASNKLKLQDWTKLPPAHYSIPPYAHHLAQFKIALDPGHGGLAHLPDYKRGPTGKQEAVMNLNVALQLKKFLELAGVQVVGVGPDADRIAVLDFALKSRGNEIPRDPLHLFRAARHS